MGLMMGGAGLGAPGARSQRLESRRFYWKDLPGPPTLQQRAFAGYLPLLLLGERFLTDHSQPAAPGGLPL